MTCSIFLRATGLTKYGMDMSNYRKNILGKSKIQFQAIKYFNKISGDIYYY